MNPVAREGTGPSPSSSDGTLVIALREGRVMAFEMLMKRYERPIFGFIFRQLGNRSRAEEVFQETFLRIYGNICSCRDPEAFKPWAFAIATNLCRNEVRRRQVRRGEQTQAAIEEHPHAGPDPERSAMDTEMRERIANALEALPEAQREVFILYQYSRLSYEEIAQVLEVPIGTVKSRMNAALTGLRALLLDVHETERKE